MEKETFYKHRDDLGSFIGGLYVKGYQVGDTLTWLGHDGVFGYMTGEEFICTEEHLARRIDRIDTQGYDDLPVYKKVGEYDIRGTIFENDETLKSIMKRKPKEKFKNWLKDFRHALGQIKGEGFY